MRADQRSARLLAIPSKIISAREEPGRNVTVRITSGFQRVRASARLPGSLVLAAVARDIAGVT